MVRLACINIPRVDLQVLALRHPDWKTLPAAVVTEEKPLGRILCLNRAAQSTGVRPGMRYASALSICPHLRAGVVVPEEREELKQELVETLRWFTPEVEPSEADAALFWVNASGLDRLYQTLAIWAGALQAAVEKKDLVCSIAVGFTRFGTYASAKSTRTLTIFKTEDKERAAAFRAPVGVLPLNHDVLLRFHQLGIMTVRDFNRFPSGALRRRFGKDVERLQLFSRGERSLPIQSVPEAERLRREMRLLYPLSSSEALQDHLRTLISELIDRAWADQELITEIDILLYSELWPGSPEECVEESLRTSWPSSDQKLWDRLLRLRFEQLTLPGPIARLAVQARAVKTPREQTDLFDGPPERDPRKALSAFADIRAELGNDAVQVAELHHAHLPEKQFTWRRLEAISVPRPQRTSTQPLVRRILDKAKSISAPKRLDHLKGPYVLDGEWWGAECHHRDYYYMEDKSGRLLWVYRDHDTRWVVQGVVE